MHLIKGVHHARMKSSPTTHKKKKNQTSTLTCMHATNMLQTMAAGSLKEISKERPLRSVTRKAGAIEPLVRLSAEGATDTAHEQCMGALLELANELECKVVMKQVAAVKNVAPLLKSPSEIVLVSGVVMYICTCHVYMQLSCIYASVMYICMCLYILYVNRSRSSLTNMRIAHTGEHAGCSWIHVRLRATECQARNHQALSDFSEFKTYVCTCV
jgi:hypothetical protein